MSLLTNELFEIRPSNFGLGLFSLVQIPVNTVLCRITGQVLSFQDTLTLNEREGHTLQVDFNRYVLCDPPFLYSNHSCRPNCAVNENLEFYTIELVQPGEELVWDYSTSMLERHWTMECFCAAQECRHIIEDFDLLPLSLQTNYLEKKIVFPFIVQHLQSRFVRIA